MLDFFTRPENFYFSTALVMMGGFFVLQLLAFLLGGHGMDGLLPDSLNAHVDVHLAPHINGVEHVGVDGHADADVEGLTGFTAVLAWLQFGRVPMLILLAVFLACFGLSGLGLQQVLLASLGHTLPAWLANLAALIPGVLGMHWIGMGLARVLPQDETSAISESQFIGQVVTLVMGNAQAGTPAQAKFKDGHGTTHYMMVVPAEAEVVFSQGTQVLLVAREGHVFQAIGLTPTAPLV